MSYKEDPGPEDVRRGVVIKTLRELRGMTRTELGRAIGKSDKLIQAIETGYRRPTPEVISNIAATLDVPQIAITLPDYAQIRDPQPVGKTAA